MAIYYSDHEIISFIDNPLFVTRGHDSMWRGCAQVDTILEEPDGIVAVRGTVRSDTGLQKTYSTGFTYDSSDGELLKMRCTCPAFQKNASCKHAAALMLQHRKDEIAREKAETRSAREAERARRAEEEYQRYLERRKEEERREEARRRQLENEEKRRAEDETLETLLLAGDDARARDFSAEPGKLHLYPYLSIDDRHCVVLGLKIAQDTSAGLSRQYVVRSLSEFSDCSMQRQPFDYGKNMTFSHREEDVCAEDLLLYWEICRLAYRLPKTKSNEIALTNVPLDTVMRRLIGRTVDYNAQNGCTPCRVVPGVGTISLCLRRGEPDGTYVLRVLADDVAAGLHGVYFMMPQQAEIRASFGAEASVVRALLRIRDQHPQGISLDQARLATLYTRVLKPAGRYVEYVEGAELARNCAPSELRTRFYIDVDDDNDITCRTEFSYGDVTLSPAMDGTLPITTPMTEDGALIRDEFAERMACRAAKALFPLENLLGEYVFHGNENQTFALLDEGLSKLKPLGELLVSDRLARLTARTRRAMTFGVTPSGGALIVQSDLGGFTREELEAAKTAYRQKRRFVRLKDGSFLADEALAQAAETAQIIDNLDVSAEALAKGAKLPAVRALYIETALDQRPSVELSLPDELRAWTKRFRMAQKSRVGQPTSLQAELRDYQLVGLSWLSALDKAGFGGILADDMGLGKTVEALAMLLRAKEDGRTVRAMVVCPASLQLNWQRECERFAPSLRVRVLMGAAGVRAREIAALPTDDTELLITSYDQLKRDVALYRGVPFTHMIIDEAQNIKNIASQAAKTVKLIEAEHRFAMTGTPIENRLSELWSIFDYLMPGYLFPYKRFRDRFETPIVKQEAEQVKESLRQLVAPFILRRLKKDVLTDLPDKVETVLTSTLTQQQREQYAAYAAALIAEAEGGMGNPQDKFRILAGLTRLRQICCDPRLFLDGYTGGSAKLDQCLELIGDVLDGEHRVLLFSQFTSMLEILGRALTERGIQCLKLTGDTDKVERQRLTDAFNAGEAQVFLISLKAGGTGLNLVGADVVIHYDPWWNTAAQNQATDRAYRIGQTRGVQVFQLVAEDTIEERIIRLQTAKQALSDSILEGDENLFSIDADELVKLLREGA